MNKHKKQSAFTLVELIVVITILAILGTIAFISLQGYSATARDSTRISDMGSMKTGLELFNLDAGKYPTPSDETIITYSGATAWTQGYFGEQTKENIDKLDKIPTDPLTDKKYVYSTTNTRQEFQLAGAMEGDEISMNNEQGIMNNVASSPLTRVQSLAGRGELRGVLNTETQAAEKTARLKISGSYNGKLLKVSTGSTDYVLAVPSIITSSGTDLQVISANNYLAYNGYKNLPFQYAGTYKTDGETNLNLVNSSNLVIFSGSLTTLSDTTSLGQTARINLLTNLQNAYTGTTLSSVGEIAQILNTNTSDSTETEQLTTTIVRNNLGGKIIASGGNTTTYSSCDFNGETVSHDTSVTAYETTSVSFGNECNSEQRMCNNGTLNGTFTFTGCTVQGATGTFNLSQTTVTQGTNVTISNTCSQAPTSYTSSNTAVATVAGTTITTLSAGTTDIIPVGGACGDNVGKTLTVNSPTWVQLDPNCNIPDITIGTQTWAGCNSTLGTGIEYTNQTYCYNYDKDGNGTIDNIGVSAGCGAGNYGDSNDNALTYFNSLAGNATNSNGDTEYNTIWGKLYTWSIATMGSTDINGNIIQADNDSICPAGRHVPSDVEWTTLENYLNGSPCRTGDGWQCDGLGWKTNVSYNPDRKLSDALKIPLAGYRSTDGVTFDSRGYYTYLWSSTPSAGNAYFRHLRWDNSTVYRFSDSQAYGFSVRCLKD
ncbi:MAG: FISUMP domain-containing protein [Candidatus Gracilibacteria bacterium]|nr:FISUMP domain-containing protein [Candidatus Gracilibacteria bacterium]